MWFLEGGIREEADFANKNLEIPQESDLQDMKS